MVINIDSDKWDSGDCDLYSWHAGEGNTRTIFHRRMRPITVKVTWGAKCGQEQGEKTEKTNLRACSCSL